MKLSLIKVLKLVFFSFFIIISIRCKTTEGLYEKGNLNEAILNSINNFTNKHKLLLKKNNTFFVGHSVYKDYYRILIIRLDSKYLYNPSIKPSENKLPQNFYEENSNLFIWYDEDKQIDEKTIETYSKYNLLIDNQNETIFFLDVNMDDSVKGVVYYICVNDLTNYKKIYSNEVKKSHPRLNCK